MSDELLIINQRLRSRNRALQRMAQDMGWLIRQPEGSLRWTGTQRDLVEMVHRVWQQHTLIDPTGMPYQQVQIARMAFAAIGQKVPKAFTRIVCDTEIRLDPNRSMVTRYERLADEENIINRFTTQTQQ
ncbi:MAG: hypothetical protein I3J02_07610 [Prevotella sp.]|nr:hypothetical protein [Prevotella sp.]